MKVLGRLSPSENEDDNDGPPAPGLSSRFWCFAGHLHHPLVRKRYITPVSAFMSTWCSPYAHVSLSKLPLL